MSYGPFSGTTMGYPILNPYPVQISRLISGWEKREFGLGFSMEIIVASVNLM